MRFAFFRLCLGALLLIALLQLSVVSGNDDWEECEVNDAGACINAGVETDGEPELTIEEAMTNCTDISCVTAIFATSQSFRDDYFEKSPLHLHVDPSILGTAQMKWDDVLDVICRGMYWGSHVSGVRLASNSQFVSSDVNAEPFDATLKGTPVLRAQLDGPSALAAVRTSTTHIGALHTVHDGAANLALSFQRALGHIVNSNLYVTPPGFGMAAGLHTDRMDGYVFQTSGKKRWQVYEPIPEANNPVWGVHGNAEWGKEDGKHLSEDPKKKMVGKLLVDVVMKAGDILYVPRGFPHTTSTLIDDQHDDKAENKQSEPEPSVAITVSTHTEATHLVFEKLVRCTFGRTGYCNRNSPRGETYCPIGVTMTKYARTEKGKGLRDSLPIGFLNESNQWFGFIQRMAHKSEHLIKSVVDLAKVECVPGIEELVEEEDHMEQLTHKLAEVAARVFQSQGRDLKTIESTFAPNNSGVPFEERQKDWAQLFGRLGPFFGEYCVAGGPPVLFKDYFSPEVAGTDLLSKRVERL